MNRRDVLRTIRTGAVAAAAWPLIRERRGVASNSDRPRFYMHIVPQGGMDPVYTTDAKKVSDVDHGVDLPYAPDQITEASDARLGPGFRALARWMPKLAIINGVRQNSANHQSGMCNVLRCKSVATPSTPSLLEILGARRSHDEATGAVSLGNVAVTQSSPLFLGAPGVRTYGPRPGLFEHFDDAAPDDLLAVAKALRAEAAPLTRGRTSAAEKTTADNLLSTAELFSRISTVPKFKPTWSFDSTVNDEWKASAVVDLQRALWLMENNLTRCVTVCIPRSAAFDTHVDNANQMGVTTALAAMLDQLFSDLEVRVVDGKPLSEQTTIVIGSEIGRFPQLNVGLGKDHFPQTCNLFYGAHLATNASYGGTGRDMVSQKTSMKTGKPDSSGQMIRVDEIGTTLLALDGADPQLYGFQGEYMRFLVRA